MGSNAWLWSLHPGAAYREVGGEFFVVTDDRAFHHLHISSAIDLFQALMSGPCSSEQLVDLLCRRYEVALERAQRDVRSFLQTLVERQIVVRQQRPSGQDSPE